MAYIAARFPTSISYGSRGGPGFKTAIFEKNSGFEKRNKNWSRQRAKYKIAFGIKTRAQMDELRALFYAVQGAGDIFRYKDWADFETGAQTLSAISGSTDIYQISKTYSYLGIDGATNYTYTRKITRPIGIPASTLTGVDDNGTPLTEGTHFTVDYELGQIDFTGGSAPHGTPTGPVTITQCAFDVPARFNIDDFDSELEFYDVESVTGLEVWEVKE
jgi:uncharacterized protein (TIGR02217 family)